MADQTGVPEEIQEEYYDSKPKERAGVAWLLAFGTLIATILVAGGIFFAGRWAYRQIAGDPEPAETTTTEEEETESEQQPDDQTAQTDPPETSTEPEATQTPPAQDNGAVAGDTTENLPGTGPEHTLAAFLAISLLGYVGHRLITRRSET